MEPTVASIAELAGVSPPTVSKVLNRRSGVSAETRRRVEELLRQYGYRRTTGDTPTASVEVVFYALVSHLGIAIMRGVEQVTREHDLAAGFTEVQSRGQEREGRSWLDQLLARRPTGVIVVYSSFTPQQDTQLTSSEIPLVALDPLGEPPSTIPSVGAMNWSGGIAAARHVIGLGHRRIALVGGPAEYLCARARLEACRAAMDTAGVPIDGHLIRTGQFRFDEGLRFGHELLGLSDPPTAVICGNDLQAMGVYEAARQRGARIPEDLSVVGFDDMDYTNWCGPPMTTVRQPFAEMGAAAARLLIALASGEKPAQTRIELATTLVVRKSTAPPAHN